MMKMTWKHIVSLLILLTACGKEQQPAVPVPSDVPIEFVAPQTKGSDELSTLMRLATQKFGVSAWYTPEGETFGTGSISYIENHRFGTLSTSDYEHATWCGITDAGVANPVYYPLDGSLSYFCYAPYREDVTNASDVHVIPSPAPAITTHLSNYLPGSPLICFTPKASTVSQIDFLVATPVLDARRGGGAVALDFTKHVTTKIEFWAKYAGSVDVETEGVIVTRIVIRDVISSEYLYFTESNGVLGREWCSTISPVDGTSTMPKASYTLSIDNNALITSAAWLDSSTAKYVNATNNGITYLLPQIIPSGAYLDLTYQVKNRNTGSVLDENTVSIPLNGTVEWPIGKVVKYTITIGVPPRSDVVITATLEDWVDSYNIHSEQELMY